MDKMSGEQIHEVLSEVPGVIRGLVEENQSLSEKVASFERRDRCTKLAQEMHRKGIELDVPLESLADTLEKRAEEGTLPEWEKAVALVGPDMGTKMASVANDEQRSSLGSSDLERYLVGGVG
jgi:uncharacterized coiled-coil DUF342 family protein